MENSMKLFQMPPLGLIQITIFIEGCIIIIASGNIWTSSSSAKVCSTMVHVIILKNASSLEESSNSICNILRSSMWKFASPIFEPTGPIFSPHLRTVLVVWGEIMTIPTITCIYRGQRSIILLTHDPWYSNI
uniref:Uncharacterized protein n=1 Tax=Opuntia streptacantha TaxID=393608 RepID=A0A7C9AWM1_OPUST